MKKSNAQAETHSNRAGAPRTSRPRTEVFEQNAQADLVPLRDVSTIFFYFLIDYKHKHTATGSGLYCAHALYV
jgi:hypothetical protein